ncbi:MAG: hypothetical protein Q8N03_07850 [Ignavibacteria bacterium]|nr:hypothetical protein [Ignavibacteria bacterium]
MKLCLILAIIIPTFFIIGCDEKNELDTIKGDAEVHFKNGLEKCDSEDFVGAIREFSKAIEINPSFAKAYNARGVAKRGREWKSTGIDHIKSMGTIIGIEDYEGISLLVTKYRDRILIKEIEEWKHRLAMAHGREPIFSDGHSQRNSVDSTAPIFDFQRAIELDSNYAEAYYNRSEERSGNINKKLMDLNRTIEIDTNFIKAYIERGKIKKDFGDYRGAIKDFTRAIKLDSGNITAIYFRAGARVKIKDYLGAMYDYSRVIEIDSTDAVAYNLRGNVKDRIGNFRGAISDYTSAIDIDRKYVVALINRGFSKYELHERDGACQDWSRAGELGNSVIYKFIKALCN